jgi:uncharacterized protein (TIGR02996 family)
MTDETALLRSIVAHPDEDTPRLALADWLDENKPDEIPSPSTGPSARAEYIRTQCRLADGAFDDPDYPELLEQEADLADWLNTHDPHPEPSLGDLETFHRYENGELGEYRRGFLENIEFNDWGDEPEETVEAIASSLQGAFAETSARTLRLVEPTTDEVSLFARHPVFGKLRGLFLDFVSGGNEDDAAAAIAKSPRSTGLRRLLFDFPLDVDGCRSLARSRSLKNLEYFGLDYPVSTPALKALCRAKWFRNLRRLNLWLGGADTLRELAESPPMPRLVSLALRGSTNATPTALRRFAASDSFPALAYLNIDNQNLTAESVAILARGEWPLRHLNLSNSAVRKAGIEALTAAPFAPTLRVLELSECEIAAGGVQALAEAESLAGLRHLDLAGNPIGPVGLRALAVSQHLRGLRVLDVSQRDNRRGAIVARDVCDFLSALDMPELRHLALNYLPVAIRGARVLAASPTFANLTRLRLECCNLGERGTTEIVGPKRLANLVSLFLVGNNVGSSVGKLANPNVFPRLASCHLGYGIPRAVANRIRRRPGIEC